MVNALGAVHTVARGPGWANVQDGRVLTRHQDREGALVAGVEIARILGVEHVTPPGEPAPTAPPESAGSPG